MNQQKVLSDMFLPILQHYNQRKKN